MKYSDIIGVEKHFKSAFDITSDSGEAWKTFISNERFEGNLTQIINCTFGKIRKVPPAGALPHPPRTA